MRGFRIKRSILSVALLASLPGAVGCIYVGNSRALDPAVFDREPGWVAVREVQYQPQTHDLDCGAAALAMVLTYWGHPATTDGVAAECSIAAEGIAAGTLREAARGRGLNSYLVDGNMDDLVREIGRGQPVVVGLVKAHDGTGHTHYEVVIAVHPQNNVVATFDPARGPRQYSYRGFLDEWDLTGRLTLVVIGDKERKGTNGSRP